MVSCLFEFYFKKCNISVHFMDILFLLWLCALNKNNAIVHTITWLFGLKLVLTSRVFLFSKK